MLNIEIYDGKRNEAEQGSSTTMDVVKRLMANYLDQGHHHYADNYYNSLPLSEFLLTHKTHSTGTLRTNRKGFPKRVIKKSLKVGEQAWARKGQVYISKWKDKRDVLSITTGHPVDIITVQNRHGQDKKKPQHVHQYNMYMSGIDRADQLMSYYLTPRKTIRWYKKVLFHLFDVAIWNSFFVYKKKHRNCRFLSFRDSLIRSMIQLPSTMKGEFLMRNPLTYRLVLG